MQQENARPPASREDRDSSPVQKRSLLRQFLPRKTVTPLAAHNRIPTRLRALRDLPRRAQGQTLNCGNILSLHTALLKGGAVDLATSERFKWQKKKKAGAPELGPVLDVLSVPSSFQSAIPFFFFGEC